ncbi:MAG: nucleotidyltransferase family protein [Rhodoferax sp.]
MRSPQSVSHVTDAHWNELIEQGRKTQLLGQLAASLKRAKLLDKVPAAVQRHLALADLTMTRRSEAALWEVATMRRAVDPKIPLVLLKGCAYLASADTNAAGRIFSDMDILVRRHDLPTVEADLMSVGWKPSRVDDYDLGYYRNWMHEVPPMAHVRRHTVVDLHHAINPPVSRFFIDPDKLFERVVAIGPGVFVLAATDRVIHCALHLLQEGEPKKLMRDLYDLHLLLHQHHGTAEGVELLRHRACELKVDALIETAVGAAHALFADESHLVERSGWLQACVDRAAREANGNSSVAGELAGTAVLTFSHWMKMPMPLLLPHLMRKAWMRHFPEKA